MKIDTIFWLVTEKNSFNFQFNFLINLFCWAVYKQFCQVLHILLQLKDLWNLCFADGLFLVFLINKKAYNMVYNLVDISFFGPYLASLNLTSSSVSVGCFIAIVGAKRLGWLAGFGTTRRTDSWSSWRRFNTLDKRNGKYLYSLSDFTGSACHFLVRLLYFLEYLNFPSAVFAWGRNTCMLWSIAARVTLATNTRYLLNKNNKVKHVFVILISASCFKKSCFGKYG